MFKKIGITLMLILIGVRAQAGIISFTSSGSFIVPVGVSSITVMAIGGGGAGTGTHGLGGGGGYLDVGIFGVNPGDLYSVIVGAGGASDAVVGNLSIGGTGGTSSFGTLLTGAGGLGGSHPTYPTSKPESGDGGSGGGGAGNGGFGAKGGSGGSDGFAGNTYAGGNGQGASIWSDLAQFAQVALTAGLGGDPSTGLAQGGGGGGGVLIDGFGIFGDSGIGFGTVGASGGHGYGAGGGSSGYGTLVVGNPNEYGTGGAGASGLVVVEFIEDGNIPAPATLALLGIGLAGLGWSRRKQRS